MKVKSLLLILGIIYSQFILSSFQMMTFAISATVRGDLPGSLSESSSLDFDGEKDFWSNNDAGGSNKIYRIGKTGGLKQSITISGSTNYDWEDLTHDASRTHMFIGDFGNNYYTRQNLRIYRIPYPTSETGSTVTPSIIKFSYPDQKKFPSPWKNFDAEGFFSLNNKLYLFTKAEGSAIKYTKMYRLPDKPGTYVATLIDSFYVNSRITGAAISPDGKSAVLISNTQIFLFRNFIDDNIFTGQFYKIPIAGSWTQKEGVSFYSNSLIYISEEGSPGQNHLYTVDLTPYIITPRLAAPPKIEESNLNIKISAYPNPSNTFVFLHNDEVFSHAEVEITNLIGQVVNHFVFENPDQNIRLETEYLPAGIYSIKMIADYRKQMSVLISVAH